MVNQGTILDLFIKRVHDAPEQIVFGLIDDTTTIRTQLTRKSLHESAKNLAAYLTNLPLRPGDKVLLAYPQSLDFVVALLACLYCGIIPIPIAPPNPFKDIQYELKSLCQIASAGEALAILTNKDYLTIKKMLSIKNTLLLRANHWTNLPWYATDDIKPVLPQYPIVKRSLTDLAYIQFTSGSTSDPKGVMISFANLAHQLQALNQRLAGNAPVKAAVWVPQYHSTCLVSAIFLALQYGHLVYFLSPLDFLKKPTLWLDIIAKYQVTHTTAPCFALDRILQVMQQQSFDWDLSCLQMLCVGGEPNKAQTLEAFHQALSKYGFDKTAFCPGYGMTEHTVSIAMTDIHQSYQCLKVEKKSLLTENKIRTFFEADEPHLTLVSNGKPLPGTTIQIIDPETKQVCPPDTIGEVWVSSPSVSSGYFHSPKHQAVHFDENFLKTGDLGVLYEGNLYITGRLKDMMTSFGKNIYFEDVERLVSETHSILAHYSILAFDLNQDLIVTIEAPKTNVDTLQHLCQIIRTQISKSLQIPCKAVIFVKENTFLYTKTGKIRRHPTKQALFSGQFQQRILYENGACFLQTIDKELLLHDKST